VGGVDVRHGSLFSGIGGFDLASEWMGWENVFHCEWNEFGKKVLKYYWPKAKSYEDITTTDFTIHRGKIDILTGGFPCQPYSQAGKRLGKEDDRHLWPEMLRAIREIQPTYVVGENVLGLVNWNGGLVFNEVQADLEAEGYEVQPFVLPACAVNAPHRRDRVWFVAYCNHSRNATPSSRTNGKQSEESIERQQPQLEHCGFSTTENATNSDCNGQQQCDSQYEVNASEGGINAQRNIGESNGYRNASDAKSKRTREQPSKDRGFEDRRFNDNGKNGNATDSISRRISGHGRESQGKQIQATKFDENNSKQFRRMGWQEFPTQPPICAGDDGLSSRLDNITFSKWRNESIKAAGNAIVPQVVYQIFQAISKMP
jgi:DNA (cytosine-5)-methyltransferase 1